MQRNRKNILLLVPTFADQGGTQKMVYELGKILSEKYNVYECSFNAYKEPHIFKNDNQVLSLDVPNAANVFSKVINYPIKIKRLRQIKEKYNIDLTISNLWGADLINALSGGSGKTIAIGHSSIRGNIQSRLLLKFKKFGQIIYNRFDRVITVNEALKNEFEELFTLPKSKIGFINNFIDYPKVLPSFFYKTPNVKKLIFVGRLHSGKNLEPLLHVFQKTRRQFPNLKLIFVGDGPSGNGLQNLAKTLSLSYSISKDDLDADISFCGFTNPYTYLESSDVFVFPSKSEGLPLVLAEAMYAKLPIIASDCPTGGPHLILQGQTPHDPLRKKVEETDCGYLMPIPVLEDSSTIDIWVDVLLNLLTDNEKALKMGEAAKKRSLDFSVDTIKQEWYNLIDEVL